MNEILLSKVFQVSSLTSLLRKYKKQKELSPLHFWKLAMRQTNKGGRKDLPSVFIFEYSSFVFIGNEICHLLDPFVGQRSTKPLSRGVCPFSFFHLWSGGPSSLILLKKGRLLVGEQEHLSSASLPDKTKPKQNVSQYPVFHSTLDHCCVAPWIDVGYRLIGHEYGADLLNC